MDMLALLVLQTCDWGNVMDCRRASESVHLIRASGSARVWIQSPFDFPLFAIRRADPSLVGARRFRFVGWGGRSANFGNRHDSKPNRTYSFLK